MLLLQVITRLKALLTVTLLINHTDSQSLSNVYRLQRSD